MSRNGISRDKIRPKSANADGVSSHNNNNNSDNNNNDLRYYRFNF